MYDYLFETADFSGILIFAAVCAAKVRNNERVIMATAAKKTGTSGKKATGKRANTAKKPVQAKKNAKNPATAKKNGTGAS